MLHPSACYPGRPPPATTLPCAWGPLTPSLRVAHMGIACTCFRGWRVRLCSGLGGLRRAVAAPWSLVRPTPVLSTVPPQSCEPGKLRCRGPLGGPQGAASPVRTTPPPPRDVLERLTTIGGPPPPSGAPPPDPPLLPFQCLRLTAKILLEQPLAPRGFKPKTFWPAFSGDHRGTIGGGGVRPNPAPILSSNTSPPPPPRAADKHIPGAMARDLGWGPGVPQWP